jgi:Protein of unknown function (DUF2501).
MKTTKSLICGAILASACFATVANASSLTDTLSSAASQLSGQSSTSQQSGTSLSSLTGLLNGGSQSLSSSSMNNAAGIMGYCAKEKIASVANVDNLKSQVLNKLGLETATEQKNDTGYMEGLQGLLSAKDGQQLNLETLGNTELGKKVKAKACDLVLKQAANYIS